MKTKDISRECSLRSSTNPAEISLNFTHAILSAKYNNLMHEYVNLVYVAILRNAENRSLGGRSKENYTKNLEANLKMKKRRKPKHCKNETMRVIQKSKRKSQGKAKENTKRQTQTSFVVCVCVGGGGGGSLMKLNDFVRSF